MSPRYSQYVIMDTYQTKLLQEGHFHRYYSVIVRSKHSFALHPYDLFDIISRLLDVHRAPFSFTQAEAKNVKKLLNNKNHKALVIISLNFLEQVYQQMLHKSYLIMYYDNDIKYHTGRYTCLVDPINSDLHFQSLNREDIIYAKDTYCENQLPELKYYFRIENVNYIIVDYIAFRTAYQND